MTESAFAIMRSGTVVCVAIELPGVGKFDLSFNAGTEWAAALLRDAIMHKLGHVFSKVREQSYEKGWKDAKAKRTKAKHFECYWGTL